MNLRYITKICCVLLMTTNYQLASGLKCYRCLHIDGSVNDPSCLNPGSNTGTARSAQDQKVTLEEVALSMTLKNGSESSKRQYGEFCFSFIGTFNGKNGALRSKMDDGSIGCKKTAGFIYPSGLGKTYIDGDSCYCNTDLCNRGSRLGSVRQQKWSFILTTIQLVGAMFFGTVQ